MHYINKKTIKSFFAILITAVIFFSSFSYISANTSIGECPLGDNEIVGFVDNRILLAQATSPVLTGQNQVLNEAKNNSCIKKLTTFCNKSLPKGSAAFETPCNFIALIYLINCLINIMLFYVAAPLAGLGFIYVGIMFAVNPVNPAKKDEAKKDLWKIVIGLVIALVSWAAIKFILTLFGLPEEYQLLESSSIILELV